MITNVKVGENRWLTVERDNGSQLPSSICLDSATGNGQLERWDNNYVYVRAGTWRLIYNEEGLLVNSEPVYS